LERPVPKCPSCTSDVPLESRFCGQCGTDVEEISSLPTQTSVPKSVPQATDDRPAVAGSAVDHSAARVMTSDTPVDSRFLSGAMLAGRYRIVGLLGRGGMGEVYRADDVKLGQPVALKFLPEALERNESRLQRFLNEVRIARQVSHVNVCRVYDIGEIAPSTSSGRASSGPQHYLSMEYVDGEDLSSLLRRIGRLPADKAVQIARQICAGLAAAHSRGVVHRDLKPSNVMLDGQGQVCITDFGLAGLAEGFEGAEIRVGTPAYMSPEQLAGKEVSVKSDIYSLGLVLYELFTGKAAFAASSLAELSRKQRETSPTSPSTLVPDLDPAVERVLLRCLEKDPALRPSSALAVAAALPGGDPLAAALEAGETPSPEMVAAAGPEGGLRPPVALAYLGSVLVGLLVVAFLLGKTTLYSMVPLERPSAALADQARQIIRDLGYTEAPTDHASSYRMYFPALQYYAEQDSSAARWEPLKQPGQIGIFFFCRQAPRNLRPNRLDGQVDFTDPYPGEGDIVVSLGLEGRLLRFRAEPPFVDHSTEAPRDPDWAKLFAAAGIDMQDFERIEPTIRPPVFADTLAAWRGVLPHRDNLEVRVEAGALGGAPVFFETITPYDPYWSEETETARATPAGLQSLQTAFLVLAVLIAVGAIFLALRNRRQGRSDHSGALRLAAYVSSLSLLYWIASGHHVASLNGESILLIIALGNALSLGLLSWVLYTALEPYARRLWPEALVSWTRLLAGRVRDPLVGRDLLIGFAFAVGFQALQQVAVLIPTWTGQPPPLPLIWGMQGLNGGRWAFGQLFVVQLVGLSAPLGHFLLLLLLRIILRKQWLAGIVYCAILAAGSAAQFSVPGSDAPTPVLLVYGALVGALSAAILLILLVRFGLLAAAGCFVMVNLLAAYPITLDASAPYFPTSLFALAVAVALAGSAFYTALAGRPVFEDSILQPAD
jgi:serine/threonine-protein kinase